VLSGSQAQGVRLAVFGTALFSTSAVLVRSAAGFGPLEVASFRLIAGAAFIGLILLVIRKAPAESRPSGGPAAWAVFAAGLSAAVHFGFYVASLYWTTVAHSLVIVNLSPLLAIPVAAVVLGERSGPGRLPGVLITLIGLAIMVGLEPGLSREQLVGDAMALLAALAYAFYSVIGRTQRGPAGADLLVYTFRVYLLAGLLLLPAALWQAAARLTAGAGPGWTLPGAAAVLLLALIPTAGGHTLYNAALRRADAVTVNLIATQEVTGGVLLGLLVLGEVPSRAAVLGGVLALSGLSLALWSDRTRRSAPVGGGRSRLPARGGK